MDASYSRWFDITERKQAEEALKESQARLANILDNSPAPIYFKDTKGRFLVANKQYQKMYDVDFEDIKDKTSKEIFRDDLGEMFFAHDQEVLNTRKVIEREEAIFGRTYLTLKFPIVDPAGELLGLGGVETDITERKRVERALKRSQEQDRQHLTQLEKVLRASTVAEMASALAHQLNQPVSAVANYSRGFLRRFEAGKWTEDELKATLEKITEQSDRAATLVRNIADFIRGSESEPSNQDINDLVIRAAHFLKPELDDRKVELELDLSDETLRTSVVPIEIEQAILNLAMNSLDALKAKKRGKRKLTLRTTIDGDDLLRVSVMDTGGGISSKIFADLFQPFTSTKSDGMGMGLAISRTIVQKHGGRIWVDKNVSRGAAFHFTLPISEEAPLDGP
jgi:PAS domain S-box-containing protein